MVIDLITQGQIQTWNSKPSFSTARTPVAVENVIMFAISSNSGASGMEQINEAEDY